MEVTAIDELWKQGKISSYERDTFYLFGLSENSQLYVQNSIESELMTPYDVHEPTMAVRVLARVSIWSDIKIIIQKVKLLMLEGRSHE